MTDAVTSQEADYLKGYSLFVRNKARELHELVNKLNERNINSVLKDEIIFGLKTELTRLNAQAEKDYKDLGDTRKQN